MQLICSVYRSKWGAWQRGEIVDGPKNGWFKVKVHGEPARWFKGHNLTRKSLDRLEKIGDKVCRI